MIRRAMIELEKIRLRQTLARILQTPPVRPGDGSAVVFSQVCGRDVLMYLLAAKSFAHHTGLADFAILDDGSLTDEQRQLLARHLPGLRIHPIASVRSDAVPAGGTWERLLLAARLGETAYVVQLDSDTLTLGPLDDVAASIARQRAFSLTSEPDASVLPITRAASNARRQPEHLLQFAVESRLDCLPADIARLYVRGCSGFTGLPPAPRLALIEDISRRLGAVMGDRWSEWGTEQVTTNLLTANAPGVTLLPPPIYSTHAGKPPPPQARFVHFMGTHRFTGGTYRRRAAAAIHAMPGAGGPQRGPFPRPLAAAMLPTPSP